MRVVAIVARTVSVLFFISGLIAIFAVSSWARHDPYAVEIIAVAAFMVPITDAIARAAAPSNSAEVP